MGFLELYGIGCFIVFVVILMYALNEWAHGRHMTLSCVISCAFLIVMSYASALVVLWAVVMNILEYFKLDEITVIKGKQRKIEHYGRQD